jgi:hypothetical protein
LRLTKRARFDQNTAELTPVEKQIIRPFQAHHGIGTVL